MRLVSHADVVRWETQLSAAVSRAFDRQRTAMAAGLAAAGLASDSPRTPAAGAVWSQHQWAESLSAELSPVAGTVAAEIVVACRSRLTAAAVAGVDDVAAKIARSIVDRAVAAGPTTARLMSGEARPGGLTAAGGNLTSIRDALDSAANSLGTDIARMATAGSNAATVDLGIAADANTSDSVVKVWTTMGDEAVRDDHDEADGQEQPVDQPFDVGGEELMYPGDPNGSDDNTINCRCWLELAGLSEAVTDSASDGAGGNEDAIAQAAADAADAALDLG